MGLHPSGITRVFRNALKEKKGVGRLGGTESPGSMDVEESLRQALRLQGRSAMPNLRR
jgi:hypothetical protein